MPWAETAEERERARAEQPRIVRAPDGDLVAIVTPPAPGAPPAGLAAVHLTRPRSHRNRDWVRGARWLAARGFAACRFDYHGNGDSSGVNGFLDPSTPNQSDLMAILRTLRDSGIAERFVLTGSCFDARTALSAMLAEPDWVHGIAFVSAPVMSLDTMRELRNSRGKWEGVWQAMQNRDNWKRLADPELWRNVESRLRGLGRSSAEPGAPSQGPALDPNFVGAFEALARSTTRALFLYGEADQEFLTFQGALERLWPRLDARTRERLEVEIWPGSVHDGFNRMDRQKEIVERVLQWVLALHPAARAVEARS
ncbi:MAG TPA: alpha/beta hydrolase [Candidatus Sulfotelmatobacter sp.]|nr:alpha/beta hydrolase [Candidatus Sulfotelmatobacter sp.]